MTIDTISEDTPDHHFRTELPNIIFELGLSAVDIAVYALLKRVAGDAGKCTCRRKTMMEKLGMKRTSYDASLNRLAAIEVDGVPLIKIYERFQESGGQLPNEIVIGNIWGKNGKYFREKKSYEQTPLPPYGTPPYRHTVTLKKKNDKQAKKIHNDNEAKDKLFKTPSPLPSRDRPSKKETSPIVFDPRTYRLPCGDYLSLRMQNALKKYTGEDKVKLIENIAYAEDRIRRGGIENEEKYLQTCISKNYAGRETDKENNRLWATLVINQFNLRKLRIGNNAIIVDGDVFDEVIPYTLRPNVFNLQLRHYCQKLENINPDELLGL